MPVKTEKELSEQLRSHWLKAVAAIELRNFGYAISLLQGILKQEPEFLTGRQLLRRAEVTKQKAEKKSFFNVSTASLSVMKAQRELKKDLFAVFRRVTSTRRKNWRPARNSGSCFRIPCSNEIA